MQKTEIPIKGVTRDKPDNMAGNGELELGINVANDGNGVIMLEKPVDVFALQEGENVLTIHRNNGYWHYIIFNGTGMAFVDADADSGLVTDNTRHVITETEGIVTMIQAIGNTLVYNDDKGISYALWKDNKYLSLGQHPPMINIQFGLDSEFIAYPPSGTDPVLITGKPYRDEVALPWWDKSGTARYLPPNTSIINEFKTMSAPSVIDWVNHDFDATSFSLENTHAKSEATEEATSETVEQFTSAVMATINKFVAQNTDNNKFLFPFFVRYAYELYDGSYIMHSYPVLMIPNSHGPVFALDGREGLQLHFIDRSGERYDKTAFSIKGRVYAFASRLQYWLIRPPEIDLWKDIIKNVSVFVTAPLYDYKQSGKVYGWKYMVNDHIGETPAYNYDKWDEYYTIAKMSPQYSLNPTDADYTRQSFKTEFPPRMAGTSETSTFRCWDEDGNYNLPSYIMALDEISEQQRLKTLTEDGVFYRVCTLPIDDLRNYNYYLPIDDGVLNTLTTQPRLADDYFSHDTLKASVANIYNYRLNLAEFARTPHDALPPFIAWAKQEKATGSTAMWEARVFIKGKGGDNVVPFQEPQVLGCKKYDNYIIPFMYGQDEDGSIKTPSVGSYWLKVYNITPGTPVKVTMNNQVGYVTTAAFMSGSIPENGSGGIDLTDTNALPTVLQTIIHKNYAPPEEPGNGSVEAIAPANTTLLVITENKLSSVEAYDAWMYNSKTLFPKYIFYPNPDAYKVQLHRYTLDTPQTHNYYEVQLQQHNGLNGAFWIDELYSNRLPTTIEADEFAQTVQGDVTYNGEIISSNAENPFVFKAHNVNMIGDGSIIALAAAVAPVSDEQFGQAPLYAFTTQGVWALSVNGTGEIATIQPITRDVIIGGTQPLSLDQTVVFMTKRGLLLLAGRHVKVLSQDLYGTPAQAHSTQLTKLLPKFFENTNLQSVIENSYIPFASPAMLAYDYINSRLYVSSISNNGFSWVYNFKSGLWTQAQTDVSQTLNSYPDCIFVQGNNVVKLTQDTHYDDAALLTRPLKLAPDALQKPREIFVRGRLSHALTAIMLCGTRDWERYAIVRASLGERMCHLSGSPYKAHTVAVLVKDTSNAALTHISLTFDTEQNNRLR